MISYNSSISACDMAVASVGIECCAFHRCVHWAHLCVCVCACVSNRSCNSQEATHKHHTRMTQPSFIGSKNCVIEQTRFFFCCLVLPLPIGACDLLCIVCGESIGALQNFPPERDATGSCCSFRTSIVCGFARELTLSLLSITNLRISPLERCNTGQYMR